MEIETDLLYLQSLLESRPINKPDRRYFITMDLIMAILLSGWLCGPASMWMENMIKVGGGNILGNDHLQSVFLLV